MSHVLDAIMIGAGQAGPSLAGRLTAAGMTVALIERKLFGGTCVNTGCIADQDVGRERPRRPPGPARAPITASSIDGRVDIDMARVKARKDAISANLAKASKTWLQKHGRCTVYRRATRASKSPTEVQRRQRAAGSARIFLNVGGRAHVPTCPASTSSPT